MVNRYSAYVALALLASGGTGRASAGIILDHSPGATGAAPNHGASNAQTGQHFADRFALPGDASVTGMDIYASPGGFVSAGDSATVSLFLDSSGEPGTLLTRFTDNVTVVDADGVGTDSQSLRAHVDFTVPLTLNAGTIYWVGMAGTTRDFTQTSLTGPSAPDDSKMAMFFGSTYQGLSNIFLGDMAFRLEGQLAAVPEPSALALLAAAGPTFAGYVGWKRRKKAHAVGVAKGPH
jgi:hypothetical protein